MRHTHTAILAGLMGLSGTTLGAEPTPVLTSNPGFLDLDFDFLYGDDWEPFGAAGVDFTFFGDGNEGHGTLFGDSPFNFGGVFQTGIPASPNTDYEMSLKIQWESNWDALTFIGLEFYAADDATKLGETTLEITEDEAFAGTGYRRYDLAATSPEGTAFIRPVIFYDLPFDFGPGRAATVDNVLVREADDVLNLNPGFGDLVGNGLNGDQWLTFGAAGLDLDFFGNGNPGHATLFADMIDNSGGVFQLGVPAIPGESYTMSVDVAVEASWDSDLTIALEFYSGDDATQLDVVSQNVSPTPGGGYFTYQIEAVAPASLTRFVRPVISFANAMSDGIDRSGTVDNVVIQLTSTVEEDCPADTNGDGILDNGDIGTFVALFLAGDLAADFNGDGILDNGDIGAFVAAFLAGCP